MLVLSRLKNEAIVIGGQGGLPRVNVIVVDIRGNKVRLGIDAPRAVIIDRLEVFESKLHSFAQSDETPASDLAKEHERRLEELMSFVACSRLTNTPKYLDGLVERLNSLLAWRQAADRVERCRDGMQVVKPVEQEGASDA